ncbi:DUF4738 domain-containing protein [Rufibacter aurantiacus]|uniref:DUF4738 domain-containing protein n=1 Tax=Rufibacter aurantiacus TaxID=2817374 RepID=UPI001B306461|nr:DUF4738 domain-containing protein [Rufibacter aurantiacus]
MKNWLFFTLLFTFFFYACKKKAPVKKEEGTTQKQPIVNPETETKPDTIYQTAYIDKEPRYDTAEVKRGADIFEAFTEAVSLNDSSIVEVYHADGESKVYKGKNHNNLYKIRLFKNGKLLFAKAFTKHDFLKLEPHNGYLKESAPSPANLKGVTADDRVLFDITFGLPDSDVGGIATLVTDIKGTPLLLQNYSHTGGSGCDGILQVTSDGKYFLNCETLYGPNGYAFNFSKPNVVHASLLTDTSFVVIYDYILSQGYRTEEGVKVWHVERDEKTHNVVVYHVNGNRLASFRYDGFFETLGYSAPVGLIQDKFLLLDPRKKELQTIEIAAPAIRQKIPLDQVKKLPKRIKNPAVKEVYMFTDQGYYYFYPFPESLQYYVTQEYEK